MLLKVFHFYFISRIDWPTQSPLVGPVKVKCFQDWNQYRSDKSARKAIIVEVDAAMEIADIHDQCQMHGSGDDARNVPVATGQGRQGCSEKCRNQDDGGLVVLIVESTHQSDPNQDRQDVLDVFPEGSEAYDGEDSAQNGTVDFSTHQKNVSRSQETKQSHVDERRTQTAKFQVISGQLARMAHDPPQPFEAPSVEPQANQEHAAEK